MQSPLFMKRLLPTFVMVLMLVIPLSASAGLLSGTFGGKVTLFFPCIFNIPPATWETVGPPKGGIYVWSPLTKTFNGPPAPGKWVLGISGIPYFCLFSIAPLFAFPGISMVMVGTSN